MRYNRQPAFQMCLLTCLLAGCATLACAAPSTDPTTYILTVGVNRYQDKYFPSLIAPNGDALAIASELEKRGTVPTLIKPGERNATKKQVLLDATKNAILSALDDAARQVGPHDTFVFAFSGSGMLRLEMTPRRHHSATGDGSITDEFYLLPSDAMRNKPETGISSSLLQAYFRKIRASRKLIILDSCRSSAGYDIASSAFTETAPVIAHLIDESVLVIGTDSPTVDAEPETGHGTVTSIILEGLRGQADLDENGIVTARELEVFTYISKYSSRNAHFRPRTLRRGCNFDIGLTDQRLKSNSPNQGAGQSKDKPPDGNNTRAEIIGPPRQPEPSVDRNGGDYALLFANDRFDNPSWATLKNPLNDVNAVARELKERYGFKEVIVRHNLTTDDIYAEVATYQRRKFQPDDQLFVFFAGHGVTDEFGGGFYVGRDSPYPLVRQTQGQFVQLDRLLQLIDQLPVEHSMVVFDACFAGQIWQPKIQIIQETATLPPSNSPSQMASTFPRRYPATGSYSFATNYTSLSRQQELSTLAYAKRIMKSRARRVLTSGDKPVLDAWRKPDGVLSNHSPFADGFLRALRSDAGSDKVLTAAEIKPFIDKLIPEPQVGKLSGAAGDFVFILATQEK